jgi:hypothetical protein
MAIKRGRSLLGVIDIHCHCGPDSLRRTVDAIDLARQARDHGMRAIVVKNHFEPTASVACLVSRIIPEVKVFGGVTLNLAVGGINVHAVEHMAAVEGGGYGRFVWMGSFDTEAQVRFSRSGGQYVSIQRNGRLLPEVEKVLDVISRRSLVLETGHSNANEVLLLIREARARGVTKIVVTHAMIAPVHMPIERMQEAADQGAWIEFVYNGLIGRYKEFEFSDYARAIRAIGPERCVLSSDLGQPDNPSHMEGLLSFIDGLEQEGIATAEIDLMSKHNPAQILGFTEEIMEK